MKTRRFLRAAAATAALYFLFYVSTARAQDRVPLTTPPPSTQPSAEEQALFDAANRERSAQSLQPLQWDPMLATAARQHAHLMVRENDLCHQCPGEPPLDQRAAHAGARFGAIAENIAIGDNPDSIHDRWMHSPGHRKNILDPDISAVGIAIVRGRSGLFAVQDFSHPVPDLSLEQQEQKVMSLLAAAGLRLANSTKDARNACGGKGGYSGPQPSAIFRFEVTDLSELPDDLRNEIRNRPYHSAAAGACTNAHAKGFVRYRIAVLFF